MKHTKILFVMGFAIMALLTGCFFSSEGNAASSEAKENTTVETAQKGETPMKINVNDGTYSITFELNNSSAASDLYSQLPLTIKVENYSDDEKIFYPKKLNTADTPKADAKAGTLGYFAPWGDVVMYYRDFGSYSGLYELGQAVSGKEDIEKLSGNITITKVE